MAEELKIPANSLPSLDTPDNAQSFFMIDKTNNKATLLDYSKLVDIILDRLYSEDMPDDGLKVYFVD